LRCAKLLAIWALLISTSPMESAVGASLHPKYC